jgi:hypothetical protein
MGGQAELKLLERDSALWEAVHDVAIVGGIGVAFVADGKEPVGGMICVSYRGHGLAGKRAGLALCQEAFQQAILNEEGLRLRIVNDFADHMGCGGKRRHDGRVP